MVASGLVLRHPGLDIEIASPRSGDTLLMYSISMRQPALMAMRAAASLVTIPPEL